MPEPDPELCNAPGPDWMTCVGAAGHRGLHGYQAWRWSDGEAEQALAEQAAEAAAPPEQPQGALTGPFRGLVAQASGAAQPVLWRGVVQLQPWGVQIDLVDPTADVRAIILPWASVARIEVAGDAPT
jgi:hypothetical protein